MTRFRTQRRIEFADTDLAGICHFSRYLVFIETAEHQFLESLGSSVVGSHGDDRSLGWPRVSISIQYHAPARFGDVLDIELEVRRKGTKSLTYGFTIRHADRQVATAEVVAVCCEHGPGGEGLRAIPIPAALADRIEEEAPR